LTYAEIVAKVIANDKVTTNTNLPLPELAVADSKNKDDHKTDAVIKQQKYWYEVNNLPAT